MTSTGDGLGTKTVQEESVNVDMRALVGQFHQQMGDAKTMRADARQRVLNDLYGLAKAKSKQDKMMVDLGLTYLFIVHGASPNVDWSGVQLIAGGSTVTCEMSEVVKFIDRKYLRQFAMGYSKLASKMHDESAEIRGMLRERTVRAGLPITETKATIDFLAMDDDSPLQAAMRVRGKYSAVGRAESQSGMDNSLTKASVNGVRGVSSIRTNNTPSDSLGPLE